MTRCLVLGGTGFVGVAACRELMRRGVETIAASRSAHPYGTFTSHLAVNRDEPAALAAALERASPDVVLDLTGAGPDQAGRLAGAFAGRCVFGSCRDDLPGIVVRAGAVLGAGDPSRRVAAYIQRVEDRGPLLLPAETMAAAAGLAWSRDVGFACALACDLDRELVGVYEVGFERLSLEELVVAIGRALGVQTRVVAVPAADLPAEASPYSPGRALDLERSRRELGFQPSALEDALAETLAWYRVARPTHPGYAGRARELELATAG